MNIEAEAEAAVHAAKAGVSHLIHRSHPAPITPTTQEIPVTQPQQQPRLVDSLHAITGEIAANPLVARLAEHGLGKLLTQPEADHIAALIASLEQPRRQAAANVPVEQQQPAQP